MKKSMMIKLAAMVLSLIFLSGCSQQRTPLQEQISRAVANKKYVLLYIENSDDQESIKLKEAFIAAASSQKELFSIVEADAKTDVKSITEYLGQESIQLPAVALIAPNSARVKMFQVPVSIEDIMNARVTEAESKVLLSLQSDRIVLLCVFAGELEAFKYIETKLSDALISFSDRAHIHYLNPAVADDRSYIDKLSLPSDRSMIHVMLPSGEIIDQFSMDTINTTDLTDLIMKHSTTK
ncbi:MAG: hypothetical protein GXX92_00805 [Clostridiales bacterium]|nr:hypothetical protein [Clostridiales bacterium]